MPTDVKNIVPFTRKALLIAGSYFNLQKHSSYYKELGSRRPWVPYEAFNIEANYFKRLDIMRLVSGSHDIYEKKFLSFEYAYLLWQKKPHLYIKCHAKDFDPDPHKWFEDNGVDKDSDVGLAMLKAHVLKKLKGQL